MSNDKLKKIYGNCKRRRDVRDWTRFDGGDVKKMKGIARFSSSETIALVISKDELMTIKEALTETAINSSLLASQKFGLLNRQIEDYLKTLE